PLDPSDNSPLAFGIARPSSDNWGDLDGQMDEVRISSIRRSSNWVFSSWASVVSNATYVSHGAVTQALGVVNLPASNLTASTVDLGGQIGNTGGAENPDVYIFWGTTDGGTDTGAWENIVFVGNAWGAGQTFSANVAFSNGLAYFYRCYITNSTGEDWANVSDTFFAGDVSAQATISNVTEGGSFGEVSFNRPAFAAGADLVVNYTVSGAAVPGVDYIALSGSVTIPSGEVSAAVQIMPIDDIIESEPPLDVTLTIAPGSYQIGTPNAATVSILDDDIFPTNLTDLVLWLRADAGVETSAGVPAIDGQTTEFWLDQSGHNRDAAQATGGLRPTFVTNGVQGMPSVRMAGAEHLIVNHDPDLDAHDRQTVFVISSIQSGTTLFQKGSGDGLGLGEWRVTPASYFLDGDGPSGLPDPLSGETRILTGRHGGSDIDVWHNGAKVDDENFSGSVTNADPLYVGSRSGTFPDVNLDGDIAEIIIFKRNLSGTERRQMESYLVRKYFGGVAFADVRWPQMISVDDQVYIEADVLTAFVPSNLTATLWYRTGPGAFSSASMSR
ncbi:MAG: hypothetical protein AAF492_17940, partial [Verrucomicrobiota bacterium]